METVTFTTVRSFTRHVSRVLVIMICRETVAILDDRSWSLHWYNKIHGGIPDRDSSQWDPMSIRCVERCISALVRKVMQEMERN